MLAGRTRIKLLRQLHDHPGQNIVALADAIGISQPYASQDMRRIQSRGFLRSVHQGPSLIYQPHPDPQVSSAAPLLKAVWQSLDSFPARHDVQMSVVATGLAHERRIVMARALMKSPKTALQLLVEVPMAPCSFHLHLRKLLASGFVRKHNRQLTFITPDHPLAKALARLLQQGVVK